MSIRKILQAIIAGGPEDDEKVLRNGGRRIETIDSSLQNITRDLLDTMHAYQICRGLSAPQIGYPVAISVVTLAREEKEEKFVLINPKIINISGKKDIKRESCMSVWGYTGEVERREKALIEYQDEDGIQHIEQFHGFEARVVLHEIDHVNGILYIDKLVNSDNIQETDLFEGLSNNINILEVTNTNEEGGIMC